jgi:hypothetical protein
MQLTRRSALGLGLASGSALAGWAFGHSAWATATPVTPRAATAVNPLDREQMGHLQHAQNLAAMPDGEWRHMGSWDPGQEWLDAYRYQLAFMAYSVALATYHHLDAAPRTMQPVFDALIGKMVRREVWDFWRETSRSGPRLDPDLKQLREPWTDPIKSENIMYSGHLHAMLGLYRMLYEDPKYDQPGSISFVKAPIFHGMGPERYDYNHASVDDAIWRQMPEFQWLGIPCEPNNSFIVCNQYPLLGFRLFDAVHGLERSTAALVRYKQAWQGRGGLFNAQGVPVWSVMLRQDQTIWSPGPDSAWTIAALNWTQPELVRQAHERLRAMWIKPQGDGTASVNSMGEILGRLKGDAKAAPTPFRSPALGYVALWLAELGDTDTLRALLAHADRHMRPTWEHGGLFYPRNDASYGARGDLTYMDPLTGNALIGAARICPPDGMRAIFEAPWTPQHRRGPSVAAVSGNAQLTLAKRLDATTISLALRQAPQQKGPVELRIEGVAPGAAWAIEDADRQVLASSSSRGSPLAGLEVRAEGPLLRISVPPAAERRLLLRSAGRA